MLVDYGLFFHGRGVCPCCGSLAVPVEEEGLIVFHCKRCEAKFTNEILLNEGIEIEHNNT